MNKTLRGCDIEVIFDAQENKTILRITKERRRVDLYIPEKTARDVEVQIGLLDRLADQAVGA